MSLPVLTLASSQSTLNRGARKILPNVQIIAHHSSAQFRDESQTPWRGLLPHHYLSDLIFYKARETPARATLAMMLLDVP